MQKNNQRFWEIDFLRGVAIIMMIIFHFLYDLNYFHLLDIDVFKGFWGFFGKFTFTLFLLLVGISLSLSSSRKLKENKLKFSKYLYRGIKVFLWGMVITFVTYLVIPEAFVRFGILHLIGISIIISYPFLRFRWANLAIGAIVIIVGLYLQMYTFDFSYLLWLGFLPKMYIAVDHFPVLPYWGIVLIGLFIGNISYPNYQRNFRVPNVEKFFLVSILRYLGKNSLLIYLIHQPLLIILLYMV